MWAIQVNLIIDNNTTRQMPTFYLDGNVTGFIGRPVERVIEAIVFPLGKPANVRVEYAAYTV